MRGVVFKGDSELEVMTFADPTPGPNEVVVQMKASGICGSDLKFYHMGNKKMMEWIGYRLPHQFGLKDDEPMIAGHEPCGVIAAVGSQVPKSAFKVGDRVMVFHYSGCGQCEHCRTGWTQMCVDGAQVFGQGNGHGGHADFIRVPASSCMHLPADVSFTAGAAISCGTGTAYSALGRLNLSARDTIAVFGLGAVGLSVVQLASAMAARVIGVDVSKEKLAAAPAFGADSVIDSGETDPVEAIKELTSGRGVSCSIDCTGVASARLSAVRSVARWGRVAFVGSGGDVTLDVTNQLIQKQVTIMGSLTFSINTQAECARFVASRGIEVDKLFTDRWSIDQAKQAYEKFDRGESLKAAIVF